MALSTPEAPLLYAFTLGLVGAVNPCGFPLLPAYLVASATDAEATPLGHRLVRGLQSGVAVTAGVLVVFGACGAAAQAGVTVAQRWAPWLMVVVGLVCVGVGVWTVAGRRLPSWTVTRSGWHGRRRITAFCSFGLVYALASLSCTLPVFVAALVPLFTGGRIGTGAAAGVAYGLGTGLVVCAVSLVGAAARPLRLRRVRALQPVAQRLAGGVLLLVGGYLVAYWISDLADPLHPPSVVGYVDAAQAHVSAWLSGAPRAAGVVLGALVLVALGAGALASRRTPSTTTAAAPPSPPPETPAPPEPTALAGVAAEDRSSG